MALLLDTDIETFRVQGWLRCRNVLGVSVAALQAAVDDVSSWPVDDEKWFHHFERTDTGAQLARTENFVPFHPLLGDLLRHGRIQQIAAELLGEPVALYKEKINYKLVGGAGFRPHQDLPAYPFTPSVISVMIAVDDATTANGCLEVSDGWRTDVLPQDERGCIPPDVAEQLSWHPVELAAGEVLFFDGLLPHRSGPNRSTHPRRALYPTYNPLAVGDRREDYYAAKRAAFASPEPTDRVRLSLLGDFEGIPV
jgi:ectoine hydroxylase-related dioxygenase (phytanoyl-CoA dioxygenase family)